MHEMERESVPQQDRIPYEACPLCDSRNIWFLRKADVTKHPAYHPSLSPEMRWMQCATCTHIFAEGPFTEDALQLVFSSVHEHQAVGYDLGKTRALSAEMIEKVLPYRSTGRWLDVGFGNGSLLFTAHEYGFEVAGLDLRRQPVEVLQAIGLDARCEDLIDARFDESFDVISMADVLEHTARPKQVLEAARRNLLPEGVLFLSMPNSDAFLWDLSTKQGKNPYWRELEHYHNFGRTRLYALLEETGFTPVRYGIGKRYACTMEVLATRD